MGRIAGQRCRVVVLADEDPRGEDPLRILDEIALGAESAGRRRERDLLLIPDRAAAIDAAFERAHPGDIVLLAGKGHERSILVGAEVRPWDERQAAIDALNRLGF
jgi:UDP-N-acetylmuramoyl-L-alanyl-D-glutamate--2,6-diaminopimelate ligase